MMVMIGLFVDFKTLGPNVINDPILVSITSIFYT